MVKKKEQNNVTMGIQIIMMVVQTLVVLPVCGNNIREGAKSVMTEIIVMVMPARVSVVMLVSLLLSVETVSAKELKNVMMVMQVILIRVQQSVVP
jgi:hypothetical protein